MLSPSHSHLHNTTATTYLTTTTMVQKKKRSSTQRQKLRQQSGNEMETGYWNIPIAILFVFVLLQLATRLLSRSLSRSCGFVACVILPLQSQHFFARRKLFFGNPNSCCGCVALSPCSFHSVFHCHLASFMMTPKESNNSTS